MPSSAFKLPKAENETPPVWREDCPRTRKIELSPVVTLYDGLNHGGTFYRKGLRFPGAAEERTWSRRNRTLSPAVEQAFDRVVSSCTGTLKSTRGLFRSLKEKDIQLNRELEDVGKRLQIMRSMPDLTISGLDFDEFLKNALAQPKLKPPAIRDESGAPGGENQMRGQKLMRIKAGSMQHIFPERDWGKGGAIKKKGAH